MNDASTLLDNDDVPLGEFLDKQIARVIQHDVVEFDDELETESPEIPARRVAMMLNLGTILLLLVVCVVPRI